jgi:hypothetical protein
MGRRNRREPPEEPRELRLGGMRRVEHHPDGQWVVQKVTGAESSKTYRCPGCDQEIAIGVPHTVAWEYFGGDMDVALEGRRHWHNVCWQKRLNRR